MHDATGTWKKEKEKNRVQEKMQFERFLEGVRITNYFQKIPFSSA